MDHNFGHMSKATASYEDRLFGPILHNQRNLVSISQPLLVYHRPMTLRTPLFDVAFIIVPIFS